MTQPFDSYPQGGRALLGVITGDNCRYGYGNDFMRLTGQTRCAYCGRDLTATYEDWLDMALDHVAPRSVCFAWDVPAEWREDAANRALACAACNAFGNRYPAAGFTPPATVEAFFDVRDRIFEERKILIAERHVVERAFFESRPWTRPWQPRRQRMAASQAPLSPLPPGEQS